jgi:Flp pilus assembly protein TadG
MQSIRNRNERGSVLVFVTLMMVLLFVMVGMGLDMGHLSFIRSQGQPAVDAAALAAVQALPTLSVTEVNNRAAQLNYNGGNPGGNNYLNSPNNLIGGSNVTLINYDGTTGTITAAASIATANGVRVALETTNPYGGTPNTPMKSPMFLTPLLNLLGQTTSGTQNVSVSAVAVLTAIPGMPIAIAGCAPASAGCAGGSGTAADPYTQCKLLQVSSSNNGNGNGGNSNSQDSGWTTFDISPSNVPTIKALIGNNSTCGNVPPISTSTCINLQNGQTPVLDTFQSVYTSNGDGLSGANKAPNPNDWGVIPVVSASISNFNQCAPVLSFAKFGIRDVSTGGNNKYLIGDLICNYDINQVGGTGCYTTQLVRDTKSGM